jgi:hypothetical protein
MVFPRVYEKPVLLSVIGAGEIGWNALCRHGSVAGSGGIGDCINGSFASGPTKTDQFILYESDTSEPGSRRFDPVDVGRGL